MYVHGWLGTRPVIILTRDEAYYNSDEVWVNFEFFFMVNGVYGSWCVKLESEFAKLRVRLV